MAIVRYSYECVSVHTYYLFLHLHVWEAEVKVTKAKQTAFPLVTGAAAVAFCPGRLGSSPSSARLLHSIP